MKSNKEMYLKLLDAYLKDRIHWTMKLTQQEDSFDDMLHCEIVIGKQCIMLKKPVPVEDMNEKQIEKIVDYFVGQLDKQLERLTFTNLNK